MENKERRVRVAVWGFGPLGRIMAGQVLRHEGLQLVGAVDATPGRAGLDVGDLLGAGSTGVRVGADPDRVLLEGQPDVVLIEPAGRFADNAVRIQRSVEAGANAISLAPEMAYPWASDPGEAERLDDLAHAYGVTVLGTGLQPGLLFDALVAALTGSCLEVERIRATRLVDLSGMEAEQLHARGIGLSPSAYAEGLAKGTTWLDKGLQVSIHLLADALGWHLDGLEESRHAIVARKGRETPHIHVEPGQVAGCRHTVIGMINSIPRLLLQEEQQVAPDAEGAEAVTRISIEGIPGMTLELAPLDQPEKQAAAMAVNAISAVLLAGAGLKSTLELPVPRTLPADLDHLLADRGPTVEEVMARGWHQDSLGDSSPLV